MWWSIFQVPHFTNPLPEYAAEWDQQRRDALAARELARAALSGAAAGDGDAALAAARQLADAERAVAAAEEPRDFAFNLCFAPWGAQTLKLAVQLDESMRESNIFFIATHTSMCVSAVCGKTTNRHR